MLAEAEEEVEDEHADLIADILDTVGKIYIKPQSSDTLIHSLINKTDLADLVCYVWRKRGGGLCLFVCLQKVKTISHCR